MHRKRGAVWVGVLVLAALGCGSDPTPNSPNNAPMTDSGPSGPFDITIASSPPIELPGVALWLDADYGVAHEGPQVRAWTDRSGHGHVLERESTDAGPIADRLAAHGALRFAGHSRMVLANTIEDQARAALTIADQDFVVAVVLRRDGEPVDPTFFALAPPDAGAATALFSLQPSLQFALAGAGTVTTPANVDGGPHVVVVVSQGPKLAVRLDGKEIGARPFGRFEGEKMDGTPVALPFLAPFVGAWSFVPPGLSGLIGDVVVLAGPGVDGAVPPLEDYLKKKYGLSAP